MMAVVAQFTLPTGGPSGAGGLEPQELKVETRIVQEQTESGDVRFGVEFVMPPKWHIYGKHVEVGTPTTVEWTLPEGLVASDVSFPPTVKFTVLGQTSDGYEGTTTLWSTIVRKDESVSLPFEIKADVSFGPCDDEVCYFPEKQTLTASAEHLPPVGEVETVAIEAYSGSLIGLLLAAFIGGLILNIMPCVLPVIGIKILGFAEHAGESRATLRLMGWAYTLGILVSFWALGAAVIAIKAATGEALGQGFQLQNSGFVLGMIMLIGMLGVSMLGVFHFDVGSGVYSKASKLTGGQGLGSAFFNGLLATLLATPCSAPFLGPAMAYAFSQTAMMTLVVFTAVGLGLAFPFIVLTHVPGWLDRLPKPGAWMETFKQVMGFVMLGFTAWLLNVFMALKGHDAGSWAVVLLVLGGFCGWIFGKFHGPASDAKSRLRAKVLLALVVVFGWFYLVQGKIYGDGSPIDWEYFVDGGYEEALETEQVVFVDVTADWCFTCQVNLGSIIEKKPMVKLIEELEVKSVKADWTHPVPEITSYLDSLNRRSVPTYVVYGADRSKPYVIPDPLTKEKLETALKEAAASFDATP